MNPKKNRHEFAIFFKSLSSFCNQHELLITIRDSDLIHRIVTVLRMSVGDSLLLFDCHYHAIFVITTISKKEISGRLQSIEKNQPYTTSITYYVPLLKRESLDTAVYALTELAVNTIQLIYTTKAARIWNAKEHERLNRIIIAASEQSKQFILPTLTPPIEFEEMLRQLQHTTTSSLFFDPKGEPLSTHIHKAFLHAHQSLSLIAGPEGDLTDQEKDRLRACNISFCALTPTVLRAHQAIALSCGIFRSFFK